MNKILISIVVGVIVGIVVGLVGTLLIEFDLVRVGNFLRGAAVPLGFLAGLYYYLTGKSVVG